MDQAIRIKFSTEKGELPAHPYFGASFPIGSKMDSIAITDFKLNTEATLFSDPRVSSIQSLEYYVIGDTLILNTAVTLNDQADTLSTSFALRRL